MLTGRRLTPSGTAGARASSGCGVRRAPRERRGGGVPEPEDAALNV